MNGPDVPAYRRGIQVPGRPMIAPVPGTAARPGLQLTVNVNVLEALRNIFASGTVPDEVLDQLYELVRNEMLKRESTRKGV